jgi:hypothetical protein
LVIVVELQELPIHGDLSGRQVVAGSQEPEALNPGVDFIVLFLS